MSADLKVGDLCVIVPPASPDIVSLQCEIVGEEREYQRKVSETLNMVLVVCCFCFKVRLTDGRFLAIERRCLRKKPPKSDDDTTPRTEFLPAEPSFVEDLQRRLTRTTEEA